MPLGSESTLGLAGPNGTPLIAELPAPADPAGGVSCAYALAGTAKLPSKRMRTSGELRDIESFRGWRSNDYVGCRFPRRQIFPSVRFGGNRVRRGGCLTGHPRNSTRAIRALVAFVCAAGFNQLLERRGIEHDDGPVFEANPVAGSPD